VVAGDSGTAPITYSSGCTVSSCTTSDPNASIATPDAAGVCRNTCKPGSLKNTQGACITCTVTTGDQGTTPTYSSGCTVSGCTTTDVNATGATLDASGACRNTCKAGFNKNANGQCVACTVTTGDQGTTPTYSSGCTVSGCTTTDVNATGASLDASGACRNTCKSNYIKNSSGSCVLPCQAGSVLQSDGTCLACSNYDQFTTAIYSTDCNITSCRSSSYDPKLIVSLQNNSCKNNGCKSGYYFQSVFNRCWSSTAKTFQQTTTVSVYSVAAGSISDGGWVQNIITIPGWTSPPPTIGQVVSIPAYSNMPTSFNVICYITQGSLYGQSVYYLYTYWVDNYGNKYGGGVATSATNVQATALSSSKLGNYV
jgi:hypothetical protein